MSRTDEIRGRIKEIIADVAFLDAEAIGDEARFIEDLELDSLSLLEIGVEVDFEYKLGLPDERLKELTSVRDAVELVERELDRKTEPARAV